MDKDMIQEIICNKCDGKLIEDFFIIGKNSVDVKCSKCNGTGKIKLIFDNSVRPCERSYKFNDKLITPDDINILASSSVSLARLIKQLAKDESDKICEAVIDNWSRFAASC